MNCFNCGCLIRDNVFILEDDVYCPECARALFGALECRTCGVITPYELQYSVEVKDGVHVAMCPHCSHVYE